MQFVLRRCKNCMRSKRQLFLTDVLQKITMQIFAQICFLQYVLFFLQCKTIFINTYGLF